jgi:uncharacterized protein (UPF0548 family)
VVSEPGRCGFAYGTLPGHPESGEEAFLLEQHDDGTVTFAVTAFSRPATALARAAGPLGRAIQSHLTSRTCGRSGRSWCRGWRDRWGSGGSC